VGLRRRVTENDRVAGADLAVPDDAQIGAQSSALVEAIDEVRVAHAHPELEAG
jgi:hypothetical protein